MSVIINAVDNLTTTDHSLRRVAFDDRGRAAYAQTMSAITPIAELLRYGDAANDQVNGDAATLSDEQLDRPLDLGLGSIRRIVQHVAAGEVTWLSRIQGNVETRWPAVEIPAELPKIALILGEMRRNRDAFIRALAAQDLSRVQRYRDSRGSLFETTLQQMLLQMIVHSTHHRAQVVNGIRRVGGAAPEVDYMAQVRRPA